MKIVLLDSYTINPGDLSFEGLMRLGEVNSYDRTSEEEVKARIGDADIVITVRTAIPNSVLKESINLRFLLIVDTSQSLVDVGYAKECGITLSYVNPEGDYSSSQMIFALLLEICHRVQNHSDSARRGDWGVCEDFCYWLSPQIELKDKTMGIVGDNQASRITGAIAKTFGMNVIVYSEERSNEDTNYTDIDILIKQSDIIVFSDSSISFKKPLVSKDNIKKMKSGIIILNNSSPKFISEEDLAEALGTGKVSAAAVDIVSTNPINNDNPLLKARNCLITPRISWATKENRGRILEEISSRIKDFLGERNS